MGRQSCVYLFGQRRRHRPSALGPKQHRNRMKKWTGIAAPWPEFFMGLKLHVCCVLQSRTTSRRGRCHRTPAMERGTRVTYLVVE